MSQENPFVCDPENGQDELTLEDCKQIKIFEIDKKTQEIIGEGFWFDGEVFSLSALAQTNWVGLRLAAQWELIDFPFAVTTKNDGEYTFNFRFKVEDFYITGLGHKIAVLASGRALKLLVKAAQTQQELDAVVDNR